MAERLPRKPSNPDERFLQQGAEYEIRSRETPADRKARIKREADQLAHELEQKKADKTQERWKDTYLFVISMAIISLSALAGLLSLFLFPATSAWAAPMLMLIVGGLIGYQTAKNQPPKPNP